MTGESSVVDNSCTSCTGDTLSECTSATCESGYVGFEDGVCSGKIFYVRGLQ